jgi:hypothetical protein
VIVFIFDEKASNGGVFMINVFTEEDVSNREDCSGFGLLQ